MGATFQASELLENRVNFSAKVNFNEYKSERKRVRRRGRLRKALRGQIVDRKEV